MEPLRGQKGDRLGVADSECTLLWLSNRLSMVPGCLKHSLGGVLSRAQAQKGFPGCLTSLSLSGLPGCFCSLASHTTGVWEGWEERGREEQPPLKQLWQCLRNMVGIFCQNATQQVLNVTVECLCFRGESEAVVLVRDGSEQQQWNCHADTA